MEKDYMQVLTTGVDGTAGQVAVNTGNQNGIEWRDMAASSGSVVNVDNGSLPYADEAEYQKGTLYKQGAILSTVNKTISPFAVMTATKVCDMPIGTAYSTASRIGEYIYITNEDANVVKFSPKNKTAEIAFRNEDGISHASSCAIGSKLYFFGGAKNGVYLSSVRRYDIVSGEYDTLSVQLPYTLGYSAAVNIGNVAYVFGGKKTDTDSPYRGVIEVDFIKNKATEIGSMPTGLTEHCVTSIGNCAYIFGGNQTGGGYSSTVYKFDSKTSTSESYSSTVKFAAGACTNIGNYVLEYCGAGNTNGLYIVDVKRKTISKNSTLSLDLYRHGAFAEGNTLYIFGGTKREIYEIDLQFSYSYDTIGNS